MPGAYHSKFNKEQYRVIGSFALMPIRQTDDADTTDIIDEAILYYRSNCLFRNFDIKGDADRVLIYLTVFIQKCLTTVSKNKTYEKAKKELGNVAISGIVVPGDNGWPFPSMYTAPGSPGDRSDLLKYLTELRKACAYRILKKVFVIMQEGEPVADKFWLAFGKRKFMNKTMS